MTESPAPARSTRSGTPLLRLTDISVAYAGGAIKALTNVSLEVGQHEIVVLLGVNGAGKTTTMRAISGLLTDNGGILTGGRVEFDGSPIAGLEPWHIVRKGVSSVLEGRRIFADLTVEENLRAGGFSVGNKRKYKESYDRVMTMFPRLAERKTQLGGLLSGGEQQMLAIGRALVQSPKLLLLDEPSLGLAPLVVQQIKEIIIDIKNQGTAVVLIEQNASMALSIADYGYVLEQHSVGHQGTGPELLADSTIRDVYMGMDAGGARSYKNTSRAAVPMRPGG